MPDVFATARSGNVEKMQAILSSDASAAQASDGHNWTALMYSSMEGFTPVVQLLIASGAPVDARNVDGWTALHFAAKNGKKAACELLLAAGANVKSITMEDGRWTF